MLPLGSSVFGHEITVLSARFLCPQLGVSHFAVIETPRLIRMPPIVSIVRVGAGYVIASPARKHLAGPRPAVYRCCI